MQRWAMILLIVLLIGAAGLDVSGLVPGAGVLAVPLLVLWGAAVLVWRALRPPAEAAQAQPVHIPRDGAQAAHLDILIGAADLTLSGGAAAASLLSGVCRGAVRSKVEAQPDETAIKLSQPFSLFGRAHADWQLNLADVAWRLVRVEMVSTHARLDLAGLSIARLVLETGGGTLDARLPSAGEVSLQISGGRTVLHIPDGIPVVIANEIRLGEVLVDERRFTPDPTGARWATLDAAGEAPGGLRLTLKGGLGTIEVRGASPAEDDPPTLHDPVGH